MLFKNVGNSPVSVCQSASSVVTVALLVITAMSLIKMTRQANELMEGQHVTKEVDGVHYVLVMRDSQPVCFALENPPSANIDGSLIIPPNAKTVQVYNDFGLYRIMPRITNRPVAANAGWGLAGFSSDSTFAAPSQFGPPPQPLVPFAGLDKKPMPPSPPISYKQMKHQVVTDKGASRKISFGGDNSQKHISDFFSSTSMEF